ncbi:hypothetical protein ACIPZ8_14650 [Pseudomonas sp. NPDC089422]|uniref:hypothetical protein n=1 Tax=Pseudomonas sp. NPDC089422 TaxID=3364466 RepID=UPI0037F8DFDD
MSLPDLGITLGANHPSTHQLLALDLPDTVQAMVAHLLSQLLASGDLNMIDYGEGKGIGLALGLNMANVIDDDQQTDLEQLFHDAAAQAREDW